MWASAVAAAVDSELDGSGSREIQKPSLGGTCNTTSHPPEPILAKFETFENLEKIGVAVLETSTRCEEMSAQNSMGEVIAEVSGKRDRTDLKRRSKSKSKGDGGEVAYAEMKFRLTIERLNATILKLESENKALAARLSALESPSRPVPATPSNNEDETSGLMDVEPMSTEVATELGPAIVAPPTTSGGKGAIPKTSNSDEKAAKKANNSAVKKVEEAKKKKNSASKFLSNVKLSEDVSKKPPVVQNLAAAATRAQDKAPLGTAPQGGIQVSTPAVESSNKLLPAITVYDVSVREIAGALDQLLGRGTFQLRMVRRSVVTIRARGLANFDRIKDMLKLRKYKFHAHTPKPLVPYAVIVEGLSNEYTEQEVLDFFSTSVNFRVDIISVACVYEDKWLLRLSRSTDIEKLYRLELVLHCKVRFRKNRGREIVQCFNCQRFGHVASNCGMQFRCVKCSQSHVPGECLIPPKEEEMGSVEDSAAAGVVEGEVVIGCGLPQSVVPTVGLRVMWPVHMTVPEERPF